MQGNSLIESFMGVDLSKLTYEKENKNDKGEWLLFDDEKGQLQKIVSNLLSKYYSCFDHGEKLKLQQEISNTITKQLEAQAYDRAILAKLKGINLAENNQFFLWHTWFSDVFNRENKNGFDIVIGNPPYLNVERMTDVDKKQYKTLFKSFYKRSDIFALFFELGLNISNPRGINTMIIPSVVHSNLSYTKLRDIILNQHWLQEVCYTGGDVFDAPTIDTTILRCNKKGVDEIILKRALNFSNPTISIVDKDFFKPYKNIISIEDDKDSSHLLAKLFNEEFDTFETHYSVFQGIVSGNNTAFIFDSEEEAVEHSERELLHPICHGRDIDRYSVKSRERRIIYVTDLTELSKFPKALKWLLTFKDALDKRNKGKQDIISWNSLHRPRVKSELDTTEKILLQRTRNEALKTRIVATLDNTGVYAMEGILLILPLDTQYDLKFLLGVLNSKLINYLFATKFLNLAIKADYLKQIKLPAPNEKISSLVSKILEIKEQGGVTDSYEKEIDKIVYGLYGLTDAEIKIVEESV